VKHGEAEAASAKARRRSGHDGAATSPEPGVKTQALTAPSSELSPLCESPSVIGAVPTSTSAELTSSELAAASELGADASTEGPVEASAPFAIVD
jgi:hypothetical protein